MAVRVHCSICDKFIKSIEQYDFQKLTGEEICQKCGKKVKKVQVELDELVKDSALEIEATRKRFLKIAGAFEDIVKKHTNHVSSFHTTRTAELDAKIKDILGG